MLDQEKQLLANLEVVTRGHKGSADEHTYLQQALKYLAERLDKLASLEPKEEASEEAPKAE